MNSADLILLQRTKLLRNEQKIMSPFRYPGGKFYALKYLAPFWKNRPHDEYREPFVGGGSVFFAKPKARFNWINDVDKNLITTYKTIASPSDRKKLMGLLQNECVTQQRHSEMKSFIPKDNLEVAHRTYYLNRTSFSGIINKPAWGFKIGNSALPPSWCKRIELAGKKLKGVKCTALDFEKVIKAPRRGETVLLYLDPPYYEADQKRAYTHSFSEKDHLRLAKLLRHTEHYFFLSYDDCDAVRKLYSWANIHSRSWWYNTANCKGTSRKMGAELIITNFPLRFESQERINSFKTC